MIRLRRSLLHFLPAGSASILLCAAACVVAFAAGGCEDNASPAGAGPGAADSRGASEPAELVFRVDPQYLSPPEQFDPFGIEVRPPRNWQRISDSDLDAVAAAVVGPSAASAADDPESLPTTRAVQEQGEGIDARPLAAFQDPSGGPAVLIVSSVEASSAERTEVLARAGFDRVVSDEVRIGRVPVRLMNMVSRDLVVYKVIVRPSSPTEGRLLQLDYVVGRTGFEEAGRRIESSIGSLREVAADAAAAKTGGD